MRKRTILALFTLAFVSAVTANPVDPQRAIEVAQQFVPKSTTAQRAPMRGSQSGLSSSIVYTHMMPNSNRPAFYIVNVDGGAFVLVSADDIAHQVLGYSLSSTWPVSKDGSVDLPEQIKGFFDDLAAQMEAAIETEPNRAPESDWTSSRSLAPTRSNPSLPDSVGPLLTTTWDQGQYYNALCPEDADGPGGHAYAGCVATAMAQIINYWGPLIKGHGTHSYETNYGTLSINFEGSNYNFEIMPDALTDETPVEQVNSVAKLINDCGVAVNMDFNAIESRAQINNVYAAFINFFNCSSNLGFSVRALYSDKDWKHMIRSNIGSHKPILYSSSNGFAGHSFILDGYNSNDYYHFNFGWSGFGDGWYKLTAINPSNDFSIAQRAIMNITPNTNSQTIVGNSGVNTFYVNDILDFYNTFGTNSLRLPATIENYYDTLIILPKNDSKQLVVDFINYKDEDLAIYDGLTTDKLLRHVSPDNPDNDLSPVVSTQNALTIINNFKLNIEGFHLRISEESSDRMVSNISATIDDASVILYWIENGNATSWKVEYGPEGFVSGEGTVITTNTNNITIPIDNPNAIIEFRIKPECEVLNDYLTSTYVINKELYWTDVVTEEPNGYYVDSLKRTFFISSAEGFAWLAKNANDFHSGDMWHHGGDGLLDYDISIEDDIDLSGHLWTPINHWFGNFNGNGHVISNLTISSPSRSAAMIGNFWGDTIRDIGFKNAYVSGIEVGTIASGTESNQFVAINCYSIDYILHATSCYAGGLFRGTNGTLLNCFAYGQQYASLASGGLVGVGAPSMMNCFASIKANNGVLCASTQGGSSYNCFAEIDAATAEQNSTSESFYFFGPSAQTGTLKNIAGFLRSESELTHTISNYSYNYQYNKDVDLVFALNQGLIEINKPLLRTWKWDDNTKLPTYDGIYEVRCPNVSNISAQNIPYDNSFAVALSWQENGNAIEWQIKCLPYGIVDEDSALYFTTYSKSYIVEGLTLGKRYDFYVRPVCKDFSPIIWGTALSFWVDKAYWVDIVTSCPEGYYEDDQGNVTISSAEGLAWLSVCSNGLNGQNKHTYEGKIISIVNNLDMYAYRWTPIGLTERIDSMFMGKIDGEGHQICNLYCREDDNYLGFIGISRQSTFSNLKIVNAHIYGKTRIGALFGTAYESTIYNCHIVNAFVRGTEFIGCLGGVISSFGDTCIMINTSSSGVVYGDHQVGGLVGFNTSTSRISNCFSSANIESQGYGYKGGLVGGVDGSVSNCYSVGSIHSLNTELTGSALGTLYPDYCTIEYVYGLRQDDLPLIGETEWGHHVVSDTASFSNSNILENAVTISGEKYDNILFALNAWVDANNAAGQYRHWIADTANVNGGYPIFAPMPKCIVAFKNANGETLQIDTLEYGSLPVYRESTPTLESTPQYAYTFREWSAALTPITGDVTFTALYDAHMFGDVTDNAAVDVQDATIVVNYILGERQEGFLYHMADMNKDTVIDVFDLTAIINVILGKTSFQAPMRTGSSGYESTTYLLGNRPANIVGEEDVYLRTVSDMIGLSIANASRFTSFQMDIEVPDGAELQNVELTGSMNTHFVQKAKIGDNLYRVIALSMSSQPLADSNGELVTFQITNAANAEISVSNVMFVTPNGEAHYFNGASTMTPTIVSEIITDKDDVIFDLSGRRIYKKPKDLERGVYIINNEKVIIK